MDLRPFTLDRVWDHEPRRSGSTRSSRMGVFRYVNGVNDYGKYVRFDEDETLTDTN